MKKSCVMIMAMLVCILAMPALAISHDKTIPAPVATVGVAAPDFTLPDAYSGKSRSLREFVKKKRPVALFFFCGCPACHAVATEWAKYQRSGVLSSNAATIIVYSTTDRTEVRQRVKISGLDPKQTAVLCDTGVLQVTHSLYRAEPCPRIVVIDSVGKIVYMNLFDDEKPQEAPAERLVLRALAALETTRASADSKP